MTVFLCYAMLCGRSSLSQKINFSCIAVELVRGLEVERQRSELWMIDNPDNSIKTERTLTDFGMTIFAACERVHTVIEMERLDAVETDEAIKFIQNAVKIIHDIVSGIVHMATVHADADLIFQNHAVYNTRKFLE